MVLIKENWHWYWKISANLVKTQNFNRDSNKVSLPERRRWVRFLSSETLTSVRSMGEAECKGAEPSSQLRCGTHSAAQASCFPKPEVTGRSCPGMKPWYGMHGGVWVV